MSDIKINGINMFINKLDTAEQLFDIDKLKEEFRLDEGESGFYKLSLSQKKVFGNETINDTYNRPPVGPIETGLYCSFCGKTGPEDHSETCDFPEENSLYLTLEGFFKYIMPLSYKGDYEEIRDKIKTNTLTQADLNDILLSPDDVQVTNGTVDLNAFKDTLTNITYFGIYVKRGPKKLAAKTTTTQFLNNIIISHERDSIKTSIRISKNGLINLINVPNDNAKLKILVNDLITRLNETTSIDYETFNEITGLESYSLIRDKTYIHSMSGQFSLNYLKTGSYQIDFENLDNLLSPFDNSGNLVGGDFTQIETTPFGDKIINFRGIKIIEWEYSLGRLTRHQVMSKEYIKFVTSPGPGLKITCIINKYGTVTMTISLCNEKQIRRGLCEPGKTPITQDLFLPLVENFNKLFDSEYEILTKKSLSEQEKTTNVYNTVSGYAPSGKICRLTRTRDAGDKTYKEGMRPEPYSWKGSCPDPNYQYLKPQGVQDTDGLWYPCCETKSKESVEKMKKYLLTGFPKNKTEADAYNISADKDDGSGILISGSNIIGATANVYIEDRLETVTVIKKLSKKSNEYVVKKADGQNVNIKGTDFERESRVFPGLNSFNRTQLINCIRKNMNSSNLVLNESGKLIKNDKSYFNESMIIENKNRIQELLNINNLSSKNLTYNNVKDFAEKSFNVKRVSIDSYNFLLHLGPGGNFYINNSMNSFESQISNSFEDTIILNGYVKINEIDYKIEYNITDIIYYKESLLDTPFQSRYTILLDLQSLLFSGISDEIFIYPDFFSDVVEGSYEIIEQNKTAKLVFNRLDNCDYITWGEKDTTDDILELQILAKNRQTIVFGYDDKDIPEGIGLDFLKSYTFNKREIPDDLYLNDYFTIKINRDSAGKIVPNRKININKKTIKSSNYDDVIDLLLIKFNPIDISFFSDPEMWYTPGRTYRYDGRLLV